MLSHHRFYRCLKAVLVVTHDCCSTVKAISHRCHRRVSDWEGKTIMAKTHVTLRLGDKAISILDKYQKDHSGSRTQAIEKIIEAYPLLKVKGEQHDLGKQIKENMPRESIMPDLCMYINDLDLNRDAIHCFKKRAWCKADACKGCDHRTTSKASEV